MQILTVDFETYYDKDFSLSKVTTEEYLRDDLFEVIGVSVKVDDEEPVWFSGDKRSTKRFLDNYDWQHSIGLAHNAMFDMAILNWHFDIRPKRIADTLSMARALHGMEVGGSLAKLVEFYQLGQKGTEVLNALGKGRIDFTEEELARYGAYCCNDADLTYRLFHCMAPQFPVSELRLIDLTIRMFTEPVLVLDKGVLEKHLETVVRAKATLLGKALIEKENLMSNPKLAETLRSLGVEPPKKISPTTGKETYAFAKNDEEFKALLEHEDVAVQAVVAARLGVKSTLEETRTQRFIEIADRGPLPIPLRYYAAHTGRWGGDDKVNMQNLPRESPLKKAMLAPEGHVFIDVDSSQIEARVLAWLAGEEDLVEAFANGKDVYRLMASSLYGKEPDVVDKDERFLGKVVVLASGYGLGAKKLQSQLANFGVKQPKEECERVIQVYRQTYPRIPELWGEAGGALRAMLVGATATIGRNGVVVIEENGIRLPNGLGLKYPRLREWANPETGRREIIYDTKRGKAIIPNKIYGGKVVENICQALARIIIGEQLLQISKRYKVVMTVHDAVGVVVPEAEAEAAKDFVVTKMKTAPRWAVGLPLDCEAKVGKSYG